METRPITFREAIEVLTEWGDRKIRPLCTPTAEQPDTALDGACDALLADIAAAPWASFRSVPKPILLLVWARLLVAAGSATLTPDAIIIHAPAARRGRQLLPLLIAQTLVGMKIPPGLLPALPGQVSASGSGGSWRTH